MTEAKLVFLAVVLGALSAGTAHAQPFCDLNLLQNPDCDEPLVAGEIPGWTEVRGSDWTRRATNPPPAQGPGYFVAAGGDTSELRQDIDIAPYAGVFLFLFRGEWRTGNEQPSDLVHIVFDFLDASGARIGGLDFGDLTSPTQWSSTFRCCIDTPFEARVIRVRLISIRRSGPTNDGYFDSLEVFPICADPVERTTWGAIKAPR